MNVVTVLMSVAFLAFVQGGNYAPAPPPPAREYGAPVEYKPPPPPPAREYGAPVEYKPAPTPQPVVEYEYGAPVVEYVAPPPPPPPKIYIRRPVIKYLVKVVKQPIVEYETAEVVYRAPPAPTTKYGPPRYARAA